MQWIQIVRELCEKRKNVSALQKGKVAAATETSKVHSTDSNRT